MRSRRHAGHCSGLLSTLLCFLLIASPAVSAPQGGNGLGASKAGGNRPTKGAPGENLPNLDDVKRRAPARPKTQPPVPSKQKKCPPDEPNCNEPARAIAAGSVEQTIPAVGAPSHTAVLGALVAAANPFAGVLLASTSASIPEPPRAQGAASPGSPVSGWFSSLIGLFGARAAAWRAPSGNIDDADCISAWGWAWDPAQPNTPIMVALYSDGQLVATALADQLRPDIVGATGDDGRHGFRFMLPDSLRDGGSHTISVRVQGTGYTLAYSPKIISSCLVSYEGAITAADCDQITGWAWDAGRPSTPIDVDLYVDSAFAARASADTYNVQLNRGDNRHQFRVPTPLAARDGQSHTITVRPAGSPKTLGSAQTGACAGPSYQGSLDYADCEVIAGWAADFNKLNTPVSVDIYAGPTFVTRVLADNFRQDIASYAHDNGRHGFVVPVPDSLRDGVPHQFTAVATGSSYNLSVITGPVSCSARAGCSAGQALASTEFVKNFYLGSLARQPRPLELQYWNDVLRTAAAQGQAALLAKAKLLGRELFLEGEYAGRGRMAAGREADYVSDLYWAYLQRGPDASGQSGWVGDIQSQNAQGQNGWLNALSAFEKAGEFSTRVSSVCPTPPESVRSYDAVADFSPLQNADGAWAYGYKPSGGSFTTYASRGNIWGNPGTDSWSRDGASCPFITRNNTGSTISYAGVVVQPPNLLNLHPGPGGDRSVARWTAPTAGTYVLSGWFQGLDTTGTTTDVLVTHNGSSVFSGSINAYQATAPFGVTRTNVAAGDVIEFSVGWGSNSTYGDDSTGLAVTIYQPPAAVGTPYGGTAAQLPGVIEAELFDVGGEGSAYHDTTAGSHGQDYDQPPSYPPPSFRQLTDVDIYKSAAGYSNGYLVVMQAGDWMKYTVDIAETGTYSFEARTFYWGSPGGTFHVEVDGVDKTGPLQLPGGSTWQAVTKAGVQLAAGRHVVRLVCDSNGSDGAYMGDIDYVRFTFAAGAGAPYGGAAAAVPGTIEVERYDEGGGGVAYHDATAGSHGQDYDQPPSYPPPSFRQPTDVDIYKSAAGYSNGYLVMMQAGDWMNYTVDVAQSGAYTLSARTFYWGSPGGTFHVEYDGADVTGPVQLPGGSGWQTVTKSNVQLAAGRHVLRVVCDTNGSEGAYMGDIDYLRLNPDVDAGLVGYWKFDEGAGATAADSSAGGHLGTLQSGAAWAPGAGGSSASLDGVDDYVQVGAGVPAAGARLTVSAWVYPTGAGSAATYGGVIVNKEGEYELARFQDGTIQWAIANQSPGWNWVNTGFVAPLNRWTLVTFTYDGASAKTYADGQLVHAAAASGAIGDVDTGLNEFRIGGRQVGPQHFQGRLDEVRVYNRALTAGEVEALAAAGSDDPTGNNFSEARKDPANETGAGGDDPLSRNFNFSAPLVGLSGRAGLDLALSLSYNSLVWTKDAVTGAVKFDADDGDPSPGFRLGLPTIQRKYRNARNEDAYMLITPSGGHVELRQVGTSNTYEATDSSYAQLKEENGLTLRPADGSQVSFTLQGSAFKPTKIEDRNGNYISLAYNAAGDVSSITDTLGRVITFAYDANGRPLAIEQDRGGQVHQWATFGYSNLTVSPGFAAGVGVLGPTGAAVLSMLTQVSLDDGSRYNFLYNSWGQVYRVERHAPDGRLLSYTEYDLQAPAAAQTGGGTDCPRFTQRRDFAKDWNNDAPAVTTYGVDQSGAQVIKNTQTLSGGVGIDTPATVMQKISYGAVGTFGRGLVTRVETWGQNTPGQYELKRTAQTTWTQDDESLPYQLNPRVKMSEVFDPQGNHTGTSYEYTSYGLPTEAREWSGADSGVLRRTHTEYNLDPAYVSCRVLGLVSSVSVYDKQGYVASKVDYTYDQGGEFLQHQGEPVQHDGENYGPSFVLGRGLLTSIRRWDVTALHDSSKSVESRMGYNTSGSPVFSRDPAGHQSSIAYADRFSDKAGTNTLAYPTLATDADGYSSKVEYNFHTGLASRTEDPKGAQRTYTYDGAGRTLRVEVSGKGAAAGQVVSGGYTRWVYSDAMDAVQFWTQVEAGQPEVCSITITDGAGRARATASDFPGSQGGYRARYTAYDIAGRVLGQTNPTEVSGLWSPAGDDAAPGWKWTTQTYDWKSRPLVTTLSKVLNPADTGYAAEQPATREVEYGGCGCAGGEVVTVKGELVPTNEPAPAPAFARRTQRVSHDPLGRPVRSEVLDWAGAVYSTTTTKYDALDHAVRVRKYAGAAPQQEPEGEGAGYQTTLMTYDGHGRLRSRKTPAQTRAVTYEYNADDTVWKVLTPRELSGGPQADVTTAFTYNRRRLPESIVYTVPDGLPAAGSPGHVPSTPNVTYGYDAAGNRTSMTEWKKQNNQDIVVGSSTYEYDALSRMVKEQRDFPALTQNTHNPYTLAYTYTLSGKLKTLTDPFGAQLTYGYDQAGQLKEVKDSTASPYAGVTTYATNVQYRAWGGVKSASFGDGASQTTGYDGRMRPSQYLMAGGGSALRENFTYYADGRLKHITDLDDGTRQTSPRYQTMSRAYTYDLVGRVKQAGGHAPAEPGGNGDSPNWPSPYKQSYDYDAFDNMTSRSSTYGYVMSQTDGSSYVNDRRQGWDYDAGGHVTHSADPNGSQRSWAYDAAGRLVTTAETAAGVTRTLTQVYDGDGQVAYSSNGSAAGTDYEVRSSVLGGEVVTRLTSAGAKGYTYVPAGGLVRARQTYNSSSQQVMEWSHPDPVGVSESGPGGPAAYDPLGNYAGLPQPPPQTGAWPAPSGYYGPIWGGAGSLFSNVNNFSSGCKLDGAPADCNSVRRALHNGSAGDNNTTLPWTATSGPSLPPAGPGGQWVPIYGQACTSADGGPQKCEPDVRYDWREATGSADLGMLGPEPQDPGKPSMDPAKSRNRRGPCEMMALNAQNEANRAMEENEDINDALAQFDKAFAAIYLGRDSQGEGRSIRTVQDALHYSRGGATRNRLANQPGNRDLLGQRDFKQRYREVSPRGDAEDQTHHFAAYFSLGINNHGVIDAFAAGLDRTGGRPDRALGLAAFSVGSILHNEPYELYRVGGLIRSSICADNWDNIP